MMRLALTAADVTGPATEDHPEGQTWAKVSVQTFRPNPKTGAPAKVVLRTRAGVLVRTVDMVVDGPREGPKGSAPTWELDTVEGLYRIIRRKGG